MEEFSRVAMHDELQNIGVAWIPYGRVAVLKFEVFAFFSSPFSLSFHPSAVADDKFVCQRGCISPHFEQNLAWWILQKSCRGGQMRAKYPEVTDNGLLVEIVCW